MTTISRFAAGLMLAGGVAAQADTIGYWRLDDPGAAAGGAVGTAVSETNAANLNGSGTAAARYAADTPGPFIYDPVANQWHANNLSLDATSSHSRVQISNDALLDPDTPTKAFTVELFVKLVGEPSSYHNFVQRMDNPPPGDSDTESNRHGWQIDFDHGSNSGSFGEIRTRWDTPGTPPPDWNRVAHGSKIYVDTDNGSGDPADYDDASDVALDGDEVNDVPTWHHVAVVFDGSSYTIYTDYVAGTTQTLEGTFEHPDALLQFGKFSGEGYGLFVDEVRYSSGALSADDFLVVTQSIPEPAALSLLTLAGAGLIRRRSR